MVKDKISNSLVDRDSYLMRSMVRLKAVKRRKIITERLKNGRMLYLSSKNVRYECTDNKIILKKNM